MLRSLRYILEVNNDKIVSICKLAGLDVPSADMLAFMKKEEEPGYVLCADNIMAHFLDGLIYFKRGKDESRLPLRVEFPVNNNLIIKKLRIAFELREEDFHAIFTEVNFPVSRGELTAILRKKGHRNYRECGDQMLRYLLKGLTMRFRGPA